MAVNAETLLALADRVEERTEPCRGLDCAIAVAAGGFVTEPEKYPGGGLLYCRYAEDGTYMRPGQANDMMVPRYTASLNDALKLVPEGWGKLLTEHQGEATAIVGKSRSDARGFYMREPEMASASGKTLALALTAACLRAKASA